MNVSNKDFANYAWHQGNASNRFLQNLEKIEEMVYSKNTDRAIEEMQSILNENLDPPIEAGGCDLEKFGGACSPVRSALIFAFAAMKHGTMGLATSQYKDPADGPKWCMKWMFEVLKAVKHDHDTAPTPEKEAVMKFIVELMIATYESIDMYKNPGRSTDVAVSAKTASFLSISCNFIKDREKALRYSERAVNLIERIEWLTGKGRLARIYQTAGYCQMTSGDMEKARTYLNKAEEYADQMPDSLPNMKKEELLHYIGRDRDRMNAR